VFVNVVLVEVVGIVLAVIKKKKGWSDSRANAYVATVERKQRGKNK